MEEEYEYQRVHPVLTHGLPFLCVSAFTLGICWINNLQAKSNSLLSPAVLFGIPFVGIALWMALIGWWVYIEEELEGIISQSIIYLIPMLGLSLWVGLISGFIPSFLWCKNERWPRKYAIFQVLILFLTYLRLKEDETPEKDEEVLFLDDFTEYSHFLGTNLNKVFYQEGGIYLGLHCAGYSLVYLLVAAVPSQIIQINKKEEKKSPLWIIILRNFMLTFALTTYFCWEDLEHGDFGDYCERINSEIAFFGPFSMKESNRNFALAWRKFHLPTLWFVRLSHAMLYPTILLMLSQRNIGRFLLWFMFLEIDFFHLLADMIHYVESPTVAVQRLEYQGGPDTCYVSTYAIHGIMAYPLNFLFLTTGGFGDPIES